MGVVVLYPTRLFDEVWDRNFDQRLIFAIVMICLPVLELLKLFAFDILAYNSSSS